MKQDNDEIDRMIETWMRPLYGFALSKTGRIDEAEEFTATLVEALCVSLSRSGIPECPEAYIWRLANNRWANWLRDLEKTRKSDSFDENVHDGLVQPGFAFSGKRHPEPPDTLVNAERVGLLRREIAFLSETQRKIVNRFYFDSMKVAEIARELGMSEGTVKWHLSAAREDLKRGMDMTRRVGELGARPVEWDKCWMFGNPGRGDTGPWTWLGRRLSQNVAYACYHQDRTLEEIAEEIGVSPVFVADEVKYLSENGFLEPLKAGKYRCRIVIEEWKREQVAAITDLYREYAPRAASLWCDPFFEKKDELMASGAIIPDDDWNSFAWTLISRGIVGSMTDSAAYETAQSFRTEHPDGGSYITCARMLPRFSSDEEKGFLGNLYEFNGDMDESGNVEQYECDPVAWSSWRLDSRWNDWRHAGWSSFRNSFEFYARHMLGRLSPENNPDEYRTLLEKGFLRKTQAGFDPLVVVLSDRKTVDRVVELLPAQVPELDALMSEFTERYLDLAMTGYPKHIQPVARALHRHTCVLPMRIFVLEHLVNSGKLLPVRQEHRLGMNMWLLLFR